MTAGLCPERGVDAVNKIPELTPKRQAPRSPITRLLNHKIQAIDTLWRFERVIEKAKYRRSCIASLQLVAPRFDIPYNCSVVDPAGSH